MSGLITWEEGKLIVQRTELCLVVVSGAFEVPWLKLTILTLNRKLCFREYQSLFLIIEHCLYLFRGSYLYQVIGDPKFADRVGKSHQGHHSSPHMFVILGRTYNVQCFTGYLERR